MSDLPKYTISSHAKITNGLIEHTAILAADDKNVHILDKSGTQVTFTLPYSKIKKAYAQLGELYISYGFGKMIRVRFVHVDAAGVAAAVVSNAASAAYATVRAQEVQGDIEQWLNHFSAKGIAAKQTLSPKKFAIIAIVVIILLAIHRMTN